MKKIKKQWAVEEEGVAKEGKGREENGVLKHDGAKLITLDLQKSG